MFSYSRTEGGVVSGMQEVVPRTGSGHRIGLFNPGEHSRTDQPFAAGQPGGGACGGDHRGGGRPRPDAGRGGASDGSGTGFPAGDGGGVGER